MANKFIREAKVVDLRQVGASNYLMTLEVPSISRAAKPGQFIEIAVPKGAVLWRRPFSIHNVSEEQGTLDILFQVLGRGTRALAEAKIGESVSIIGPLGNGFHIDSSLRHALIAAGGLGIAPFLFFLKRLRQADVPATLIYGVGTRDQFCCVEKLQELADVRLCTMDGSAGYQGTVVDLLQRRLEEERFFSGLQIFTCGPAMMMEKVQQTAARYGLAGQASLETVMACGFGACVGCAVRMKKPQPGVQEYFLACKDGPVFNLEEIIIHD